MFLVTHNVKLLKWFKYVVTEKVLGELWVVGGNTNIHNIAWLTVLVNSAFLTSTYDAI